VYDFYLGSREEIARDEMRFLIAIKRMMPRWINSLPDSEFTALAQLMDEQGARASKEGRKLVIVETGVGASSLACVFYALKYAGLALSWDYNGEKGSLVRTVCTETMGKYFHTLIDDHWKLVAHGSVSPYLGLPILSEFVDHVDLFFHDSEHVWQTVKTEIEAVMPLLRDQSVVALDDANQGFLHTNIAYINTFRKKLGLAAVAQPADNIGDAFYVAVERLLRERWEEVEYLPDSYKENFRKDPYFNYYDAETEINADIGTVRMQQLEHRFASWRVSKRRTQSPAMAVRS
jgi:Methyltransferase domain